MAVDKTLDREVASLARDLATKSAFELGDDLPLVGDALKRMVAIIDGHEKRIAVLEAAAKAKSTEVRKS